MRKEIGKRIKFLREERGISQKELSKMICVSRKTIKNWEEGICKMRLSGLIKIKNFFDVSVDYLLIGNRENKNNIKNKKTKFKNS